MRNILICSGVHARPKCVAWLRRIVEKRQPDAILFAGGVLDTARHYPAQSLTDWGLTTEGARFIEHFFEALGSLGVFSAVIPGQGDTPLEDFLRMGMHAEIECPQLHLAHATLIEKGDAAICGIGGSICEGTAKDRHTCSRTMAEYHLRSLWKAKQPYKILLLAEPPAGDLGGEQGSELTAELIDSFHPSLCVVAGPSERRGMQRIASTLVINPGHLAEGWAAWLDRSRVADEQVEFLNLRDLELAGVAADVGCGD